MDWALRSCGWHGHATYRPDEPELRERLHTQTVVGDAWRCLRCGAFVPGAPAGSGPADRAPEIPHGRLLRDRMLMRLLAIERGGRALVILALGLIILRFKDSRDAIRERFDAELPLLRPLADQIGWSIDDSRLVRGIHEALDMSPRNLTLIALAILAYSLLQAIEAVGLWLVKRWGEYFAVVATSMFLPLEVYELAAKVTWLRLAALTVNLIAVAWLLWSKRLFGLRGGSAAYYAEHHAESLLTVERAAAAKALADRDLAG